MKKESKLQEYQVDKARTTNATNATQTQITPKMMNILNHHTVAYYINTLIVNIWSSFWHLGGIN